MYSRQDPGRAFAVALSVVITVVEVEDASAFIGRGSKAATGSDRHGKQLHEFQSR